MIKNIKKMVALAIAALPMALSAQSTTENHVVTKTYKVKSQTPITTNDANKVFTTIQYTDGLGRPKQSVLVKGGSGSYGNNQLHYDWTLGHVGSTPFYIRNGDPVENQIINGTTPFGDTDLLWECVNDAASNSDGGFNTIYFDVDHTKAYRYTVWVKRTGSQDGKTYHGTRQVNNLDGTANSNPYFWYGDLPQLDTWYLMVGYIHPSSHTGGDVGISGVYDTQGNKVLDGTEFKWDASVVLSRFRSYLYYATDTSVRQYFWSPVVQKIDGTETPLSDLLTAATVFNNEVADAKDIVTHYEYDALGRQTKEFLPYASGYSDGRINTDAGLATQSYYQNHYADDFSGITNTADINSYSDKVLESSPLGRIFEQTAPGEDWKIGSNTVSGKGYSDGHSIRFEYGTNAANEVKRFDVSLSYANKTYTPNIAQNGFYNANELTKTITKDENWTAADGLAHTTEEFKNKQGQVILKRTYALVGSPGTVEEHNTYYVYDNYGNLSFVLPPKASDQTITTTMLDELGYQYKYDYRNRLVEKKIPGKGWEYIIYDKLDRPLLTQDAVQRLSNKWLYTKYDKLGRVAFTGEVVNTRTISSMQNHVNATNNMPDEQYEVQQNTAGPLGIYYSDYYFPTNTEVFAVNYYDSYVDLPSGLIAPTSVYGQSITTNVKGLATVSKVKVLDVSPQKWITTVTYYDDLARPVYVYSHNEYLETTDIVASKLDFTGKVLETKTTHSKVGKPDVVTVDVFEYDHQDRLISQTQKINNQLPERIVRNNYDDLGQLKSKLTGNGTQSGYTDVTSGITITDNVITKTSGSGSSWNNGLATLGSFQADGYLEYEVITTNDYYMVGLSSSNVDAHFSTLNFAIYGKAGDLRVYENGIDKGLFGSYDTGDILRLERIGNKIYYKKNGEVFYISASNSSGNLLGDISIASNGVQIKNLHIVDNSKGLQNVDYNYNVRGWLTKINEDTQSDNDLFNFTLRYNNPTSGTALFNGNIAQTAWNTASSNTTGNPVSSVYTYSYDALNRITSAVDNTGNYNLTSVSYDKNGNILNLQRQGHTNPGATLFGAMDNLTYTYDSGNKLIKVADAGNTSYGFKDGANQATEYTYDANGNMITDANKGITSISYNHLNLPVKVVFNNNDPAFSSAPQAVTYIYAADGTKMKKKVWNGSLTTTDTDYAGNHMYENGDLQFFNQAEGYVKYNGGTTTVLIDNRFESGTDGWGARNGASLQQDNGRLKVTAINQYDGAHKFMNAAVGDRIEFNIQTDKGTTASISVNILEHDSNGTIKAHNLAPDENGYVRGSYMVTESNTVQLSIKVEKRPGADNGTSTSFYIDNATFVKVSGTGDLHTNVYQYKDHLGNIRLTYADSDANGSIDIATEIVEESNYYPFGLKHKGYNTMISSNGNSSAQKFKYNGVEFNESLGLNLYEMELRLYSPTIARWNAIDPVTHHSMSTYNAFDNNPVFWADPSGSDSENRSVAAEMKAKYLGDDATGVDDIIKVDTKNKVVTITPMDGPDVIYVDGEETDLYDLVSYGGRYDIRDHDLKRYLYSLIDRGYSIWNLKPVGMGATDAVFSAFLTEAILARLGVSGLFLKTSSSVAVKEAGVKTIVKRVGTSNKKVIEFSLDKIKPLHSVPRPGKPLNYVEDLAKSIKNKGFNIIEAVPIIKMPNGVYVSGGGHHRIQAMKLLGEKSIPSTVRTWNELSSTARKRLLEGPNGKAYLNYLK